MERKQPRSDFQLLFLFLKSRSISGFSSYVSSGRGMGGKKEIEGHDRVPPVYAGNVAWILAYVRQSVFDRIKTQNLFQIYPFKSGFTFHFRSLGISIRASLLIDVAQFDPHMDGR